MKMFGKKDSLFSVDVFLQKVQSIVDALRLQIKLKYKLMTDLIFHADFA